MIPGTLCTGAVFDGFLDAIGVPRSSRHYIDPTRPVVTDYHADFDTVTDDMVVCGFSLGAIIAAHAADRMTPHCLFLFGLNPFADDPKNAGARRLLAQDVKAVGGAEALISRNLAVHGARQSQTRAQISKMATETSHMIDAQIQLALDRPAALNTLTKAKMPVVALTGTQDATAPLAQGQAAADAAPMGQFFALEGLGHYALIEDPTACASAVLQAETDLRQAV